MTDETKFDLVKSQNELAADLNAESEKLTSEIMAATNWEKQNTLTNLFNINQQKKTVVRQNKLSDLQDKLVEVTADRVINHSDEMETKQLFDGLKVVQDIMERNQKQLSGQTEEVKNFIQINQTNNGVDFNQDKPTFDKDSRQKIQDFVNSTLNAIISKPTTQQVEQQNDVEMTVLDEQPVEKNNE